MKIFYEKDANQNLIKNKKVAIFGFGSQGQIGRASCRERV